MTQTMTETGTKTRPRFLSLNDLEWLDTLWGDPKVDNEFICQMILVTPMDADIIIEYWKSTYTERHPEADNG